MKNHLLYLLAFLILPLGHLNGQDTFSMVAMDTATGEVGSCGASCVDLFNFPGFSVDFLGELFPGVGAINTQAYYIQNNQANARNRMNAGDSPQEIIDWLVANDVANQPQFRQYGIVGFDNGVPTSAAHTGASTDDYKNHILGPNYAIQGNILLGQEVLDSMEARFLREEGDLACKLMAALQGANMVGADTRCAPNGTSSLFAFVKVAQTTDVFGSPSFVQSIKTQANAGIEPIDSLQNIFDAVHTCEIVNKVPIITPEQAFQIFPNPSSHSFTIEKLNWESYKVEMVDINGKLVFESQMTIALEVDASDFPKGVYFVKLSNDKELLVQKFVKQ